VQEINIFNIIQYKFNINLLRYLHCLFVYLFNIHVFINTQRRASMLRRYDVSTIQIETMCTELEQITQCAFKNSY